MWGPPCPGWRCSRGGCGPGRRLWGQLFHLHVGPSKPQREPVSAFPGGSAGRRAAAGVQAAQRPFVRGLPVASCSQPRTRREGQGFPVTCAGHSWPPRPTVNTGRPWNSSAQPSCPAWGRRRRGQRGAGILPGQDSARELITAPSPRPTPLSPWGGPLLGCAPSVPRPPHICN